MRIAVLLSVVFIVGSLVVGIPAWASSTVTYSSPWDAKWVDANQVKGTLWFSHDVYAGKGVAVNGSIVDPCDRKYAYPVTLTLAGVRATPTIDPNNQWTWIWRTEPNDAGKVFYAVLTATAVDPIYGTPATNQGTVAVRVLPAFQPPVIRPSGCRTVD